jgi:hypothetical protein
MKSLAIALGLLAATFVHAAEKPSSAGEKGFELHEVSVGKTAFKFPLPKWFVTVGREEEWAKAFHERFENLATDPRRNIKYVFVQLTPEHLAHCREAKVLDTGLDCWGTVKNQTADREFDLAAFAKIAEGVAAEFAKSDMDDIRKKLRREVKDEEFNQLVAGLGNPAVVGRTERSLQFIMPSGPNFILGGFVLVEGKLFNIYLQRPRAEVRELLVQMDDWVAEINKTTRAERK